MCVDEREEEYEIDSQVDGDNIEEIFSSLEYNSLQECERVYSERSPSTKTEFV